MLVTIFEGLPCLVLACLLARTIFRLDLELDEEDEEDELDSLDSEESEELELLDELLLFCAILMKIYYDFLSGYRKVYEQYAAILQEKYPDLLVEGENFPPPAYKQHFAQFLGVGKLLLIACVLGGMNPFQWFGTVTPAFWNWASENKLYACMMTFFLSNFLESQLLSTGAFEVTFNDVPIWSKIQTGRVPQPPELFQILDSQLQMSKMPPIDFSPSSRGSQ
nr:EOG090X0DP2 [Lepidurus arcticus]